MQYTILIPGGFKPPHKGHYDYIKFYLDKPQVDKVILFCGNKSRDGVTLEQTEAALSLYGLMDHPKLDYRRAMIREGKKKTYTNPLKMLSSVWVVLVKTAIIKHRSVTTFTETKTMYPHLSSR
jgi:nicotinamide mononucleotide adenylyltransferase